MEGPVLNPFTHLPHPQASFRRWRCGSSRSGKSYRNRSVACRMPVEREYSRVTAKGSLRKHTWTAMARPFSALYTGRFISWWKVRPRLIAASASVRTESIYCQPSAGQWHRKSLVVGSHRSMARPARLGWPSSCSRTGLSLVLALNGRIRSRTLVSRFHIDAPTSHVMVEMSPEVLWTRV